MKEGRTCFISQDVYDFIQKTELPRGVVDSFSAKVRERLGVHHPVDKRFNLTPRPKNPNKRHRSDYSVKELAVGEHKIFSWVNAGNHPYTLGRAVNTYGKKTGKKFCVDYSATGRKVTRLR